MIKVVTVEQMREIERIADESGLTYSEMMQHAGKGVADVVKLMMPGPSENSRVVVLVGPGNNGGDGLVTARILREDLGIEVSAYLLKPRADDDAEYAAARDVGVFIAHAGDDQRWRVLTQLIANADIVIDALLGTGARLPVDGNLLDLLRHAQQSLHRPLTQPELTWPAVPTSPPLSRPIVIAVDCPSGLNCDSGELDPAALYASITVTFGAAKVGQFIFPGADAVGELVVAEIGIPHDQVALASVDIELADGINVGMSLPPRSRNSHKGTFGRAVVVAGSINYTGAAALSGSAVYRAGAGLVTMAVAQAIYPILAAQLPEATWILLPHELGVINSAAASVLFAEMGEADVMLFGPGLGRDDETGEFVRGLLGSQTKASNRSGLGFGGRADPKQDSGDRQLPSKLVIDADGLNLLATIDNWWTMLPENTVLTPHPGEMGRLTGISMQDVIANRFDLARQKAAEWGVVIVLKGAFTIVAEPGGRLVVIPFASDALATAGTGDVLAGCITGLMAQGSSAYDAAVAGTYLHGLAGILAAYGSSTRSVIASDLLRAIPSAFAAIEPHDHTDYKAAQ
jgi:ADP-dependent NAD(P)H-hydrate dehydratase / NAD(P)H-hydrate epimerase